MGSFCSIVYLPERFHNTENKYGVQMQHRTYSGDSRMKKVGGPLRGQGKIRGDNINIYLAW